MIVASLGAGSGFGGIALPFIGGMARGERPVRCVSVEPSACPKLTRGRYAYDYSDTSGLLPMQKMYTLGHTFVVPGIHAGGLRYHGTAKLVSALSRDREREQCIGSRADDGGHEGGGQSGGCDGDDRHSAADEDRSEEGAASDPVDAPGNADGQGQRGRGA